MKVILKSDIKGTGKKGDLIEVSDGYARNFLFPRKLAEAATAQSVNELNAKREAANRHAALEKAAALELKEKLEACQVEVKAKGGSAGRLFGSVTAKEVADAMSAQLGSEIDKKKIVMDKDIKTVGDYEVSVKLYAGVAAKVTIKVSEA